MTQKLKKIKCRFLLKNGHIGEDSNLMKKEEKKLPTLQIQILREFRRIYPQLTFQQISDKTQIQLTRVFRIFNGSEMKIHEFEIFSRILKKEDVYLHKMAASNESKIYDILFHYLKQVSDEEKENIEIYFGRKLEKIKLKNHE